MGKGLATGGDAGHNAHVPFLMHLRLIEEADYAATQELFGAAAAADLDGMLPKSAKDFEHYAEALVAKYLIPHRKSPHYKLVLKQVRQVVVAATSLWCHMGVGCTTHTSQVIKHALTPLSVQETKDVETCVAGVRADKLKAETAAKAAAAKSMVHSTVGVCVDNTSALRSS